ncbi:MAG: DUF484 family protein [Gammaproteobacteria bacterium]|jgi:uncharacterized protein
MSIQDKRKATEDEESVFEAAVAGYLRDHPDFFVRWPAALEELQIPHPCGKAVSLIEHQVVVLRRQVQALRMQLQDFVRHARNNEILTERVHHLTLRLIQCRKLTELLTALYAALIEDFKVDAAVVKLFVAARLERDRTRGEFVAGDAEVRSLFVNIIKAKEPVCGRLRVAQLAYLFGERQSAVSSVALLPLGEPDRIGFLAIGSQDPYRFQPGMGTAFLKNLAEIVTRLLYPHLATA